MERKNTMETTMAVPNPLAVCVPAMKGRAIGALICGAFGGVWMLQALYYGAIATPVRLTVITLLTVMSVGWPVTKLLSLRRITYSSGGGRRWAEISKTYWTIVAVEWISCGVAVNVLYRVGHPDLTPQAIGVIVGLHFLPLAKIFRAPIYYWTGAAMTLGVLAALVIPAGDVRNLAGWAAGGLTLWATAAVMMCQDKLSSR